MKKQTKKNDKFTPVEVGALIEALRSEIRPIFEAIPGMQSKLDGIFEQVGKNTEGIQLIKSILNGHSKLLDEHSGLLNHILKELKSKVDRKDFELLEKKVASFTA